ncbi:MAG: GtrA family protein [Bacteroidales bacterium]
MSDIVDLFYTKVTNRFVRFVLVGGVNFIFGTGLYCLFVYMRFSDWWAFLLANVIGVMFNFKTTGILVFRSHANSLIVKFALCYVVVYVGEVYLKRFMEMVTLAGEYWSGIISIVMGSLVSFVMLKYFVFKNQLNENDNGKEEN